MYKVKINKIEETVCTLFYRNQDNILTEIGKITSELQLNDVRIQIREKALRGYEVHWLDTINYKLHHISIGPDGVLEEYPKGFYDIYEKQIDKLTDFWSPVSGSLNRND